MNDHPDIVACIVTYKRATELRRLLNQLVLCGRWLRAIHVVDNASEKTIHTLCETMNGNSQALMDADSEISVPPMIHYFSAPNDGPGAGWKRGAEQALQLPGEPVTHLLMLDDDVVLGSVEVEALAQVAAATHAGAVAPLLTDTDGKIWGFPEPRDPTLRAKIRELVTPQDAVQRLGTEPLEFCWCTGACVLVSREAVEAVGYHRTDFWMLGEDLEYSMRIADKLGGVFLPGVIVPHLPPPPSNPAAAKQGDLRKFCALLTNLGYLSFHVPHSAHMRRYLAGNYKRLFRTHGINFQTCRITLTCLWRGVIVGKPAGKPTGTL